jgi:transcription initiation factor TFIIH subunit 4
MLPSTSQQLILRFIHFSPVDNNQILAFLGTHPTILTGIEELKKLGILECQNSLLSVNSQFRENLCYLTSTLDYKSTDHGIPMMSYDKLQHHMENCWENILQFLLNLSSGKKKSTTKNLPQSTIHILSFSGLISKNRKRVTFKGINFLFLDRIEQLSILIKAFVELHKEMDLTKVVQFLLKIGFWSTGRGQKKTSLSPLEQKLAKDWNYFGLVYKSDDIFYPTLLGSILLLEEGRGNGFIIVESNFYIYAYTSSPAQIGILSLFSNMTCKLPNLVMFQITRDSIRRALDTGITSQSVVRFLRCNFHTMMKEMSAEVISSVFDQILLWSTERTQYKPRE